ncbi:potassium voltage-gated channel subfamily E regulatory beta subunit 5 [Fukomys damarensis]|uniref:Potassium voltage-gated channel subfamily E member 1-like protein n=1 Tax=Fukomys damarensis TaxID=885580 RepID=A0A091D1L8_FUKDA|nr:potassium voltage-gated channel subfamily E regulatory beta subunit 5 [Fukomys damarensis]KFO24065.1 Potassium voltage-gated channel subfamily E member 1-like protein [Fukomys damarensis]
MNCSDSQWLQNLLSRLLLELHHQGNASGLGAGSDPSMGMGVVPDPFGGREVTSAKGDDAYLYILLIMIFYACLAGGFVLAYTRSRKLRKDKAEPTQTCTALPQRASGGALATNAETAAGFLAEGRRLLAPEMLPTLDQGTERV